MAGPHSPGAFDSRRAVTWWALLLFFICIGPALFLATHSHRRLQSSEIALRERRNIELRLQQLHREAEKTGRLGRGCPSDSAVLEHLDRSSRFLICANLHNSAAILPHWITQLTAALQALPAENIFVSVYESGSTDDTNHWLQQLRLRLELLGVRQRVVLQGNITRREGQARISYLAGLRNEVLRPLLPGNGSSSSSSSSTAAAVFDADYVIFLNDVHFCAGDLLRLTLHKADLACGLDLWYPWLPRRHLAAHQGAGQGAAGAWQGQQQREGPRSNLSAGWPGPAGGQHRDLLQQQGAKQEGGAPLQRQRGARKRRQKQAGPGGQANAAPEQGKQRPQQQVEPQAQQQAQQQGQEPRPMEFYDFWVAREITGHRFGGRPPYVSHAASAARLQQGLPVPAYCCWNGMAVMRAAPFKLGVRFRGHQPGECRASECSLLCDDFHRLGFTDVVVDPGVRSSYKLHHAQDLYTARVPLQLSGWAQVAAAPSHRSLGLRPEQGHVECCDLAEGQELVDWSKPCRFVDVMGRNFTSYVG